jgi:hypothetical protein
LKSLVVINECVPLGLAMKTKLYSNVLKKKTFRGRELKFLIYRGELI